MGAMRLCFLLFCLFLTRVSSVKPSVCSVRKLNSIEDLTNTNYAESAPRHGRQLLFWFAQRVLFDQNNNMYLNFNPRGGDFGFHWYGNEERDLPQLESGESYYSVGNLHYPEARALPNYVRTYYIRSRDYVPERNMDRLMIVLRQRSNMIARVYITAHNLNRNDFNPSDTYEIDPDLILQIRENYDCRNYLFHRTSISSNTVEDRCRLFLEETRYSSINCIFSRDKRSPDSQCHTDEKIQLEIKTTTQGYAKLIWDNVPIYLIENGFGNGNLYIDICQNIYSSDTNKDPKRDMKQYFNIDKSSGALDTFVLLNAGLQPQLRLQMPYLNNVFWYGPEFDGANKVLPVRIRGNDASLQLYAKDGKACARLYIKKTFSNWKNAFTSSWVGFYKSSLDKNYDYSTYQYAVNFAMIDSTSTEDYNVYQYDSSLPVAPGVQIRFLLEDNYKHVLAQTTPWEMDEESVCYERERLPELPSSWSFPEFFYEPEFYDANNVVPVKIKWFDAGLQLFTKEGKACARLYIMKTFTDWNKGFYNSWVGFYTSSQKENKGYDTYQYAVNFEKMEDGTNMFDFYQYKSSLVIAPGVQIRFFLEKEYYELVATEPWKSGLN
ncbi:uncharacterized protein LOC131530782 [Onychostoma macrolepis]|nr:uncharacterized protein LOC131530782 [Onychostoma macrolepis]